MGSTSLVTIILVVVILVHFLIGFGYLVYKLSPRKGDKKAESNE
jgi:flagellar basal body-associated protein FliL